MPKNFVSCQGKIAPGMSANVIVKFCPETTDNYQYQLLCYSEEDHIAVPIYAEGEHGIVI